MKSDAELITELQLRVGELEQAGTRLGELLDQARAEVLKLTDQRDVSQAELGKEKVEHYLTQSTLTMLHRALVNQNGISLYLAGVDFANWHRNHTDKAKQEGGK